MEKKAKKKRSTLRRVLDIVSTVIVLGIMALLAFVVISNLRGGVTYVAGKAVVWVKTDSMEPTIPAQSYILVESIDPKDVQVGDVILFVSVDPSLGGSMNTHRVVEIEGDHERFITKGDNPVTNPKADDYPAYAVHVKGVYRKNLPFLSMIGRFLSTSAGITTMIITIFAITAAAFMPDIIAGIKDREKEKKQSEMDALVQKEVERLKAEATKKTDSADEQKPDLESASPDHKKEEKECSRNSD